MKRRMEREREEGRKEGRKKGENFYFVRLFSSKKKKLCSIYSVFKRSRCYR
jgi:hypothetical protein